MHPNSAHMRIRPNPTMAASLFRPSKIQDGRHFLTKIKIKKVTLLHLMDLNLKACLVAIFTCKTSVE